MKKKRLIHENPSNDDYLIIFIEKKIFFFSEKWKISLREEEMITKIVKNFPNQIPVERNSNKMQKKMNIENRSQYPWVIN